MAIGFAIFLFFKSDEAIGRFGWTFLLVNLMGFVTYHLYPAAPPWYFHAHGCTVDLVGARQRGAEPRARRRVAGLRYFHGFYGRSNDVFGAVPSLHVAYPLLILLEGWRWMKTPGRVFFALYTALMGFGAVYLDHHWIIDVLLGLVFVNVAYAFVWMAQPRLVPALARSPA